MKALLRYGASIVLAISAVVLLFLTTVSAASDKLEPYFPVFFVFNIFVVLVLVSIVLSLVSKLITRYRQKKFGSRMLVQLVVTLSAITFLPALLIYFSSNHLLSEAFDSGIDSRVERALEASVTLSQETLQRLQTDQLVTAQTIADRLNNSSLVEMTAELARTKDFTNAATLILLNAQGQVIAHTADDDLGVELMVSPQDIRIAQQQGYFASLEGDPLDDDLNQERLAIRTIVPVTYHTSPNGLFLQIRQVINEPVAANISTIVQGLRDYQQIIVSRDGLQQIYRLALVITLTLVSLFSIVGAFALSQRWTAPIRQLAEGTRRVTGGHYQPIQEFSGSDEINELTRTFNIMVREINDALAKLEARRESLEQSNIFQERILENISTGIIVLDHEKRIKTANLGAVKILGNSILQVGVKLAVAYTPLFEIVSPMLQENSRSIKQEDVTLIPVGKKEPLSLFVRCSSVPLNDGPGYLIVIDDMTQAIDAQRVIAWGEVARRMAHEIKNPLTPIQLAAERMQIKLSKHLPEEDVVLLDRYTNTIVEHVSSIKQMVNDFRDYAKLPKPTLKAQNLNVLIDDVATLYRQADVCVTLNLDPNLPPVEVDRAQLLQVLHNLFSNAKEAKLVSRECCVSITTKRIREKERDEVILIFEDNGPGFQHDILSHAFEPYITTKATGTGLGLPMVKKIIEEHHGYVQLSNRYSDIEDDPKGAIVTIGFTL